MFENINSILSHHSEENLKREKEKIQPVNTKILSRSFDFEHSIKFGLQRVKQYDEKVVKDKILNLLPLEELKEDAKKNSENSGLHFKDEFVKSLLKWFRYKFFSWCDQPICTNCNSKSGAYFKTEPPSDEEKCWLASRTEVYKCNSCQNFNRFPRYNNPLKLCETKTGRCGEWANVFGCILKSLDYEVRFVDNFEDHVWNEYYSESLRRWVHVDSCETAWDTPLMYEQGWGRNMTFILAHSTSGIYDVTRRYVKDWNLIAGRRSNNEIDKLNKFLEIHNNILRENTPPEMFEDLYNRDMAEQCELLRLKDIKEAEFIGRQSGCEEWRKDRGEIK